MKRLRFYGVIYKKSPPNQSQTEERRTFFVSSEEFQLFLLLPSQRVDDGDGQSERFLRVAVGPQCVHPGTRCRDVLCRAGDAKEHCNVHPDFFVFQPAVLSHAASPCQSGHPRASKRALSWL